MMTRRETCMTCGRPLSHRPVGRPRRFCCGTCRQVAYRRRAAARPVFPGVTSCQDFVAALPLFDARDLPVLDLTPAVDPPDLPLDDLPTLELEAAPL